MKNSILEPIGMYARITESVNSELVHISGVIIDETKHMLKLDTKFGEKLIPKNTCEFKIIKNDDVIKISGLELLKHSHERLEILS